MREIKFRQWLDNKWHYWGLIDGAFVCPADSSSGNNPSTTEHCQFTGLKDKNGKEIYEGDIVKNKYNWILEVKWENEIMGFNLEVINRPNASILLELTTDQIQRELEIKGNIYENKELLDEKN